MSDAVMVPEKETQYEVWQDDCMVASADTLSDAQHYAAIYGRDGPVKEVTAVTTRFPGFNIVSAMLAASPPVGGWEEPDEQDVLDTISDAIGDSMDLDWTYSIGAKAIVEAFKREGWTVSAPPPPSVSTGSRPQEAVPTEGHGAAVLVLKRMLGEVESFPRAPDSARIWIGGWSTYSGQRDPSLVHVGEVRSAIGAADGCSSNEGADVECPACDGSGKIVEAATTTGANQHSACQHDCEDCDGSGRILPQTEKGS